MEKKFYVGDEYLVRRLNECGSGFRLSHIRIDKITNYGNMKISELFEREGTSNMIASVNYECQWFTPEVFGARGYYEIVEQLKDGSMPL